MISLNSYLSPLGPLIPSRERMDGWCWAKRYENEKS
jgi:hypothetical protein